jgi:DNA repair protein RadD
MAYKPHYYQQEAVDATIDYLFSTDKNPLIKAPTGSGKSLIIAELAKRIHDISSGFQQIVLTDITKLILQNNLAMLEQWPSAKTTVFSASYKSKDHTGDIVFAGIQSVYRKASLFENVSVVYVDEAHRVSLKKDSMYYIFFENLKKKNPHVRIVTLSASPWKMESGTLEGSWLVDDIVYEISMTTLFDEGFLCPLITPEVSLSANTSSIKLNANGEFNDEAMQQVMDDDYLIEAALDDAMKYASDRKSILVFACGVEHAYKIKAALAERGEISEVITGDTELDDRTGFIERFEDFSLRWLISINTLTTGFDVKSIDCGIVLRATQSSALWLQIIGRLLRTHFSKINAMVLDYGENISRFRDITKLGPPPTKEAQKQAKRTPFKKCGCCDKLVKYLASECPFCFTKFGGDIAPNHGVEASTDDIIEGASPIKDIKVLNVTVDNHHSRVSKKNSLRVTYHCGIEKIHEYFHFEGNPHRRSDACRWWAEVSSDDLIDHCPKSLLTAIAELKAHGYKKATSLTVDYTGVKITSGGNYMGHKVLTREY